MHFEHEHADGVATSCAMVQTTGSASVHAVAVATGLATYGGSAVAAAVV